MADGSVAIADRNVPMFEIALCAAGNYRIGLFLEKKCGWY
jgi:hypothetical protein